MLTKLTCRTGALAALLCLCSIPLLSPAATSALLRTGKVVARGVPDASSSAFTREMHALWRAIADDSPHEATSAFFPERAYVELKHIENPEADFQHRLFSEYALDIEAAHRLLHAHPGRARLLRVVVDRSYAHLIPVGVCYNSQSYYELPNARVVYEQAGQVRSFGIASMISWDDNWYVIHLGAVLRSGTGGEVDAPQEGPGRPAYSSTC